MSKLKYSFQDPKISKAFQNPNFGSNQQLFNIYSSENFTSPLKEIDPLKRYSKARQGRLEERSKSKSKNGQILSSRISVNSAQSLLVKKKIKKIGDSKNSSAKKQIGSQRDFSSTTLFQKLRKIKKERGSVVGSSLESLKNVKDKLSKKNRVFEKKKDECILRETSFMTADEKYKKFKNHPFTMKSTLNAYSKERITLEKLERLEKYKEEDNRYQFSRSIISSSIENFKAQNFKRGKFAKELKTPLSTSMSLSYSGMKSKGKILLFNSSRNFNKNKIPNFNSTKVLTGRRKEKKKESRAERKTVNGCSKTVKKDEFNEPKTSSVRRGTYSAINNNVGNQKKIFSKKKFNGKKRKKKVKRRKKNKKKIKKVFKIHKKSDPRKENQAYLANLDDFSKGNFLKTVNENIEKTVENLNRVSELKNRKNIFIKNHNHLTPPEDSSEDSNSDDNSSESSNNEEKKISSNLKEKLISNPYTSKSKSVSSKSYSVSSESSSKTVSEKKFDFYDVNENLYSTEKKLEFKSLSNSLLGELKERRHRFVGEVSHDLNMRRLEDGKNDSKLSGTGGKLKPLIYPFKDVEEDRRVFSDRVEFGKSASSKNF